MKIDKEAQQYGHNGHVRNLCGQQKGNHDSVVLQDMSQVTLSSNVNQLFESTLA
jgi:hypothetical protein